VRAIKQFLTRPDALIEEEESGYLADRDANSDDARTPRPLGIGNLNALFLPKAPSKAFEHPLTGRQGPAPQRNQTMKNFSLDDSFLAILMVGMLGLFGSVAYEAKHNGMTDPVVAVSAAAHNAVAMSNTAPEAEDRKFERTFFSQRSPARWLNTP